jgi:hypothetical protein
MVSESQDAEIVFLNDEMTREIAGGCGAFSCCNFACGQNVVKGK